MKNFLYSLLIVGAASTSAMAKEANLFTCQSNAGDIKVELAYSSTSFIGQPQLNLSLNDQIVSPAQDENTIVNLQQTPTLFGTLVSVSVYRKYIADAPSLVYGAFLPHVRIDDAGTVVPFTTVLLTGANGGMRAPNSPTSSINAVVNLDCEAQAVLF